MTTKLIDTHAHLTFPEFDRDREKVILNAWKSGLEFIILVGAGAGLSGNEAALRLSQSDDRFFVTVGVHPHDAATLKGRWVEELRTIAADQKVVAVGEIGLDYHHKDCEPQIQKKIFKEQIRLAADIGKPIVIHDREAHEDAWRVIEESAPPDLGCVFHCFSGDVEFAGRIVEKGFYISVPGIVTFSNARQLQAVVAEMPLEQIVLETDCPFLAPAPNRGKRNEPSFVTQVAQKIAEIKSLSFEDVARVTTLNAKRVFGLPGSGLKTQIAYQIRNSIYLNITNRCNLACRFCPKHIDYEVKGYYLKLDKEPDVEQIFQAVGQPDVYDEVVFCGYGEPTLRLEILKIIAKRMKEKGAKKVRLNTDGLANLVYGKNVLPELEGLIDSISISLNAPDAVTYQKNCPSKFGESAYEAVCEFVKEAKKFVPVVVVSVVAFPGIDLDACRKKAHELDVPLRVREYMNVG